MGLLYILKRNKCKKKYNKKQRNCAMRKLPKTKYKFIPWKKSSQPRGQAMELKQTVNRQCTYTPAQYVSG
jgi:hypothetical protein